MPGASYDDREAAAVIFATVGSSPIGFARMMQALEAISPDELTVQHGPAPVPPGAVGYDFLPFGRIVDLMRAADVVISHAGVGSIMCALQAGHMPIVFPRYERFGETVDDHQAELAAALAQRGTVVVASDGDELLRAIASVPPRGQQRVLHGTDLNAAVRAAIHGERPRTLRRAPSSDTGDHGVRAGVETALVQAPSNG
jgi:UDP-N-acetylglucosamine transferase subunit ALG13